MRLSVVWFLVALVVATYALTLNRFPIEFGDGPFYASIARSLQQGRPGIPSILKQGPTAVDHVRFYGPVFFSTLATWFTVAGFSSVTFRMFCLAAAVFAAAGAVAVSWSLGGGPKRRAWAALLILLSPELGFSATFGRMDAFAVALEMFGLAIFVHGITYKRRPWLHGVASGAILAAAALTTPRTFPFMLGFAVALVTVLPRSAPSNRGHVIRQTAACCAAALFLWLLWTFVSSGGPSSWFHMMSYIATHEDMDVALLRPRRSWMFVWWQAATPAFACVGALVVAYRLRGPASHTIAAGVAIATAWIALVVTWTLFENAFLFETLAILPLFAVVLAVPILTSDLGRRRMAVVGFVVFCFFVGIRGAKIVRGLVTWTGRNPAPLSAFVRDHVPPGSEVLGPDQDYFFPVEESGSRYLIINQVSAADWARWMVAIDRRKASAPRPLKADYLLWPDAGVFDDTLLPCLSAVPLATYHPPPADIPALAHLVEDDARASYAATTLYRLKFSCSDPGHVD